MKEIASVLAIAALAAPTVATTEAGDEVRAHTPNVDAVTSTVAGNPSKWPPHMSFFIDFLSSPRIDYRS